MSEGRQQGAPASNTEEDVRAGYHAALTLWTYEGQLIWTRYSAMLVANSIAITAIGLSLTADRKPTEFVVVMCLAGFTFCLAWFLLTKRGFDYYRYWILSAREVEEEHLADSVKIVSRGGLYGKGNEVTLRIDGKEQKLRMSWFGRLFPVEWISYFVIVAFVAVYAVALALAWTGESRSDVSHEPPLMNAAGLEEPRGVS